MSSEDKEYAKLSEQAERYDDMAKFMVKYVQDKPSSEDLSIEDRNLLSVAFKNLVGSKRTSWRVLSNIQLKESNERQKKLCGEAIKKVEEELRDTCEDVVSLIDNFLLSDRDSLEDEAKVFYLKMKADYFRYLAEVGMGGSSSKGEYTQKSEKAYDEATEAAKAISPVHPIKLGLCLNYSVFRFEIQQDSKRACEMAQCAMEDAVKDLENLSEEQYKDSCLIVQLLRDNLSLWNSDQDDEQDDED